MSNFQLSTLVDFCLNRRALPDTFHSLLKQLNHRQEVSEQDIESLLSNNQLFDPLLVVYISSVSLTDQSTKFKFSTILSNLNHSSEQNQYLILSALATELRNEKEHSNISFSNLEVNESIQSIFTYLKHLLNQKQDSDSKLFQSFTNLLIVLLPELVPNASSINSEQSDLLGTFIIESKSKCGSLSDELDELIGKLTNRSSISGSLRHSISINPSISNYNTHSTFLKTSKLPKFIWLNSAILNWSTHKDNFLSLFDQFVKVKTNKNTLNELLAISFEGFAIVLQSKNIKSFFFKSWKLFLLKRLPILIKELNLKNVDSSLINAIHLIDPKIFTTIKLLTSDSSSDANFDDMFSSFPSTTTDVRHDFLKSCIALHLLPPSSFKTILNEDAAADGGLLPTTDEVFDENSLPVDFQMTLNTTLIDINTEFIPLEDSGLLDFLNLVNDMEGTKQLEVSKLILSTIHQFIKDDDKQHLSRLSLAFGLCSDSLSVVIFHLSPAAILKPLMNFLDKLQTDSEDMNFQENYSAFGCIFLLFLLIVKKFDISLSDLISYKEDINQPSFCIKYLNNLGSSRQLVQTNSNKEEILNNWMTALFDSGGISDDLMRLSTVQECFEIFPSIFQQAYIGCKQGLVDIETVKGGLEYFLQPFLLSTIIGFIFWSENYLWKNHDVETIVNLLKTLLSPLDLSGESIYIHKVILNNFTKGLYIVLDQLDNSPSGTKIDPEFLSILRQSTEKDISSSGFFEYDLHELSTPSTISIKNEDSSLSSSSFVQDKFISSSILEEFHNKFLVLLNWSQSSSIPKINYQFISNLAHLLGADLILEYFLTQITISQTLLSTNGGKSSQLLIELSSYFLVINFVDSSSKSKILKLLKEEKLIDDPREFGFNYFKLAKTLIEKKQIMKNDVTNLENDVFGLFYDKLLEDIQTIGTLN